MHHVSSCDKRTSYVLCLQELLLTVWAGRVTINMLPDDVLVLIFHFDRVIYLEYGYHRQYPSWKWHRLVHVCRRWRSVVFASPNFLDLKLIYRPNARMELTGIWPPFPIVIMDMLDRSMPEDYDFDAAIVYRHRVCEINLINLTRSQLQRLASAMQVQFSALIHLRLQLNMTGPSPAFPDGFLSGSVSRLQSLELHSIAFPALPKLLLSATHLVRLTLWDIPHSGYFSPEAFIAFLAVLANLKSLAVGFSSSLSHPGRESRRPPSPTRTVLPALTRFVFRGDSEFLEDVVARIDALLLDFICITFFPKPIFDIPQLAQYMRRATTLQALNEAHVVFNYDFHFDHFVVQVGSLPPTRTFYDKSRLRILCREPHGQLSSLAQVCTSFLPSVSMVEHLYIYGLPSQLQDDTENVQWLEILHPFTSVKNLYLPWKLARCILFALQVLIGERGTDALPALESLFLDNLQLSGPVQEAIEQFIAARQLSGHHVAVSHWER
jgi:hypothetical protein